MSTIHHRCSDSRLRLIIVCLGAIVISGSAIAFTVYPRQVAATYGEDPNDPLPVWETHVATDGTTAIAVYHRGKAEQQPIKRIAYTVGSYDPNDPNHDPNQPWTWQEKGVIDTGIYESVWDPTIAYDPTLRRFVAAAGATDNDTEESHIVVSFYDPNDAAPGFTEWAPISWDGADKPWLIAGEKTTWGRELYIIWGQDPVRYARSVKGGADPDPNDPNTPTTWGTGQITIGGDAVRGTFCAHPACRQRVNEPNEPTDPSDPLYIAYRRDGKTIRFLKGVDDNTDPNSPTLTFSYLWGMSQLGQGPSYPVPLNVATNATTMDLSPYVADDFYVKTTPWLVADPTDAGRLYLLYQDIVDDQDPDCIEDPDECDVDVDVFIQKITQRGSGNSWVASSRVRVNQDDEDPNDPNSADQFTPTVLIDDDGNLHVIFYDDRRWPDQSDGDSSGCMFDVYYAVSTDQGSTWEEHLLYAADPHDPNEVEALDSMLDNYGIGGGIFGPFEYPGLGYYVDETREFLLASFTGTDPNDPYGPGDGAVIYSSLIELDPNDPNNP
jgi:hypothetical protein